MRTNPSYIIISLSFTGELYNYDDVIIRNFNSLGELHTYNIMLGVQPDQCVHEICPDRFCNTKAISPEESLRRLVVRKAATTGFVIRK